MPAARTVRLDKWLWAARFFKTRALAADAIDGGRVHIHGERAKRSKAVGPGDELRVRKGAFEYRVTVRSVAERRGSAAEAALLYDEDPGGKEARLRLAAQLKAQPTAFYGGKGKPTKKQRRAIDRLKSRR